MSNDFMDTKSGVKTPDEDPSQQMNREEGLWSGSFINRRHGWAV